MTEPTIKRFLTEDGKIKQMPARREPRHKVLRYLATKLEPGREYSYREINELIMQWHTFSDFFLLRRELCDSGLVLRPRDGSVYWLNPDKISELSVSVD